MGVEALEKGAVLLLLQQSHMLEQQQLAVNSSSNLAIGASVQAASWLSSNRRRSPRGRKAKPLLQQLLCGAFYVSVLLLLKIHPKILESDEYVILGFKAPQAPHSLQGPQP